MVWGQLSAAGDPTRRQLHSGPILEKDFSLCIWCYSFSAGLCVLLCALWRTQWPIPQATYHPARVLYFCQASESSLNRCGDLLPQWQFEGSNSQCTHTAIAHSRAWQLSKDKAWFLQKFYSTNCRLEACKVCWVLLLFFCFSLGNPIHTLTFFQIDHNNECLWR